MRLRLSFALLCACSSLYSTHSYSRLLTSRQMHEFERFKGSKKYLKAFPYSSYSICSIPDIGRFYVDPRIDIIKTWIAQGKPWEPEIANRIYQYARKGTIALDIGAHIGTHTMTMSKVVGKTGLVIAFEPQKKIFRELTMNTALNKRTNIITVNCALGNKKAIVHLAPPTRYNEGGRFIGEGTDAVPMAKLDDFGLRKVSFMKIDVENFEDIVLKGAVKTIKANRPIILIEIQGNTEQAEATGANRELKTKETIKKIRRLGYKVSLISNCDYLAIPK